MKRYMKKSETTLQDQKVLDLLGIARIAKKTIVGQVIFKDIKKVRYLFVANDASLLSQKKYFDKCKFYNIEYCTKYRSEQLSHAIGQNNIMAIGIIDQGFKNKFVELNEGGMYDKSK